MFRKATSDVGLEGKVEWAFGTGAKGNDIAWFNLGTLGRTVALSLLRPVGGDGVVRAVEGGGGTSHFPDSALVDMAVRRLY